MPKPHYPTQGGPRRAAISHGSASGAMPVRAEKNSLQNIPADNRNWQALQAEVERLQRELAQAKARPASSRTVETAHAVWIAAALCIGSLLFALAAISRRG